MIRLAAPARLLATVSFVLAGCAGEGGERRSGAAEGPGAATGEADATPPAMVTIREAALHPEGIEWDAERDRFLAGSLTHGKVTAVEDDGALSTFAPAPEPISSVGIHVDGASGRLLVAYADPGVFSGQSKGAAKLGIYDLASGERLHYVDLAPLVDGWHFANDVTADAEGNAYVTDSFQPVIYRVTPAGEATVFTRDKRLIAEGFGANGIDWHPDGFLIVSVMGSGSLQRVPVSEPGRIERVALEESFGADGIDFREDGSLAAVAYFEEGADADGNPGRRPEVLLIESDDGWRSARIAARADMQRWQPTTVAIRDGEVYAIAAHLAEMFGGLEEPVREFEIVRVDLGEGDDAGG